jgi:hypothetical protein
MGGRESLPRSTIYPLVRSISLTSSRPIVLKAEVPGTRAGTGSRYPRITAVPLTLPSPFFELPFVHALRRPDAEDASAVGVALVQRGGGRAAARDGSQVPAPMASESTPSVRTRRVSGTGRLGCTERRTPTRGAVGAARGGRSGGDQSRSVVPSRAAPEALRAARVALRHHAHGRRSAAQGATDSRITTTPRASPRQFRAHVSFFQGSCPQGATQGFAPGGALFDTLLVVWWGCEERWRVQDHHQTAVSAYCREEADEPFPCRDSWLPSRAFLPSDPAVGAIGYRLIRACRSATSPCSDLAVRCREHAALLPSLANSPVTARPATYRCSRPGAAANRRPSALHGRCHCGFASERSLSLDSTRLRGAASGNSAAHPPHTAR